MTAAEIFVSYRRNDPSTGAFISNLEAIYGPDRVFVDADDLRPGVASIHPRPRRLLGLLP